MAKIKCTVIPKPEEGTKTVFKWEGPEGVPFIRGGSGLGLTTYVCGKCGRILVENVAIGGVRNLVFECPNCQSYNEIPGLQ